MASSGEAIASQLWMIAAVLDGSPNPSRARRPARESILVTSRC